MDESKMLFARIARRTLVGPLPRASLPGFAKGILTAPYNPAAPGVAPRFCPPVLSLFRLESA